jgi:hypothetical protein
VKTIIKPFKELDFDAVDFESGDWSYGRGGFPLEEDQWAISCVIEDFQEIRYPLPLFINQIINYRYVRGKEDAKAKIREALGI